MPVVDVLLVPTVCVRVVATISVSVLSVLIEGQETRAVGGFSKLAVESFYQLNSNDDIYFTAKTNLAVQTTSGIMSFKSGDKLNMKSAKAMDIKTEADGLTIYSEGLVTETFKASQITNITGSLTSTTTTTWTHTSGGNIVITGGPNIDLNP